MEIMKTLTFRPPPTMTSSPLQPKKKRTPKPLKINSATPISKSHGKPDPSTPNITRPCTECGKQFWSWKALFGHMRCHPERKWRGINPPANIHRQLPDRVSDSDEFSEDDYEIASCLLMLSNGQTPISTPSVLSLTNTANHQLSEYSRFECSSCKKVFGSRQALGGHRATHKNVKGCHAISKINNLEGEMGSTDNGTMTMMSSGFAGNEFGHTCGVCFRVFSSGQALGGHMRCHWEQTRASNSDQIDLNLAVAVIPMEIDDNWDQTRVLSKVNDGEDDGSSGLVLDLRLGL